ncbi:hypothetical protein VTO42DRAFT_6920 [Malbranchea cinnamomea]
MARSTALLQFALLQVLFLLLVGLVASVPTPDPHGPERLCTAACRPERPECGCGYKASGSEGCWGCCVPA